MKHAEFYANLSRGASAEKFGEWMRFPTEVAAADGELEQFTCALEYLVRGGVSLVGYRGNNNRTLFDAAALGGNAEIVRILLDHGAKPDISVVSCSSGKSALYLATSLRHNEVAKTLIWGGADVSFRCVNEECDVLLKAISLGMCRLVPLLLGKGASVHTRGKGGVTTLHVSSARGCTEMTEILLANGVDKDALDDADQPPVIHAAERLQWGVAKLLMRQGVRLDVRNSFGRSLIHILSMLGQVELVTFLLDKGIDIEEACPSGRTPLMFAAYHGQEDVVDLLLKRGANRNVTLRDRTPLVHAIIKEHVGVLEKFLKNGEDADSDELFLRVAVGQDKAKSIEALVKGGADIEKKDHDGYTPLMYSVCKPPGYKLSAMEALLLLGADVSCKSVQHERTALHHVCATQRPGFLDAIRVLLRWGADESVCDGNGRTLAQCIDLGHGPEDDRVRARILISRAPADRVWRRRGWLLMTRLSLACKEGGESAPKVLRVERWEKLDPVFAKAVEFLTGVEVEDVFRSVLKFL